MLFLIVEALGHKVCTYYTSSNSHTGSDKVTDESSCVIASVRHFVRVVIYQTA